MHERDIFIGALQLDGPVNRGAYLDRACGADPVLRRRVEGLLRDCEKAAGFLNAPAPVLIAALGDLVEERPGTVIGPYKLLEQIGEGGMGVVYVAEQQHPVRRKVALKLIKPGMDSRQVIARFEAERQALAMMDHPNIAKVHDGGVIPAAQDSAGGGRPYFVMELVKGTPITDYCDRSRLTVRQRLALFLDVCHAVQHAHQKGIIHRDLKPSNVMVAVHDVAPVVKVIDFGIAKAMGGQLTDKSVYTAFEQLIGTPMYMSPEQAGLSSLDVDTRSDVYSLGVLLYELLTGTTPFDGETLKQAGFDEMRRIVREEEPPRPSARLSTLQHAALSTIAEQRGLEPRRISQHLRGELDWLVMRAMEKDRNRRYETASAFAADVERYLNDEPVQACPPSAGYRLKKFARRHKAGLLVASALLAFLGVLTGSVGWIVRDREARHRQLTDAAELALDDADRSFKARNWPQARAAALRAQDLLATGAGDEQRMDRAANLLRDLDMLARVEEIRLESATVKDEGFDEKGADASFAQAFQEYGIDVKALSVEEAASRIRQKLIAVDLIAALDAWAEKLLWNKNLAKPILDIARQADPDDDTWRRSLRLALEEGKSEAILRLASQADQQTLAPTTVVLLVHALIDPKTLAEGQSPNQVSAPLAVSLLLKAQEQHPDDFWINHELGFYLYKIQPPKLEDSVGFYRAALALRPQSSGAWLNLGEALKDKGDLAGATAAHRRAITLKPDYAGAHSNLGNALKEKGDLAGAIAEYQKAIAFQPNHANAHCSLGSALLDKGDLAGAIAECQKAITLKPNLAMAHNTLGCALFDKGDLASATMAFQKAIALNPDLAMAHSNLGNTLRYKGDLAGAIAAHQKAIALRPNYDKAHTGDRMHLARVHRNLATILRNMGKCAEAEQEYRQALAIGERLVSDFPVLPSVRKDRAIAHNEFGILLNLQGKNAEAQQQYLKALAIQEKLAGDFPETLEYQISWGGSCCNLGNSLRDGGQASASLAYFDKAIRLLKAVCEQGPGPATSRTFLFNSYFERARANMLLDRGAESVQDCERALALNMKLVDPEERGEYATALCYTGRVSEAIAEVAGLAQSVKCTPNEWYIFARVYALASGKDSSRQQEYGDRAMELLGRAVQAGYRLSANLKRDPEFVHVRNRDDFKVMLRQLENQHFMETNRPEPGR